MGKYPSPASMILNFLLAWSLCSNFNILVRAATASEITITTGTSGIYTNNSHYYHCMSEEREALLRFKHDIVDSCGFLASWGSLSDHHAHDDGCSHCQWRGVRCSNHTGRVIGIHLGGTTTTDFDGEALCKEYCLQGKVNPSLLELKHLKYLDLSCNSFHSQPIPKFLGSLPNLKRLNLSNAAFAGEIPHQLGNLSKLTSLDLSQNEHHHLYVKTSLEWLSRLTLLRDLDLTEVELSQATDQFFEAVTNLPFLRTLHGVLCNLSSPNVRSTNYNYSTQLSVVSLSGNNFKDTSILQRLFNLSLITTTPLKLIDLSYSSIKGPIPSYFWNNLLSLSYLDLSNNELEGHVPPTISNLKRLTYLDLSENKLLHCSSQCVKALGNLCSLQTLHSHGINMNDDLSNIIHALSTGCVHESLLSLHLSSTQIWGSIPDSIAAFPSLRELVIANNQLNGTICNNHLSNLSRLVSLDLSDNPELVINITPNWIPPFQLKDIDFGATKFGFHFPKWLLTQTNVKHLNISNVGITDTISPSFWNWLSSNLIFLDLSHNQIHGELPIDITSKFFFGSPIIDMSSNNIEGAIPSFSKNVSVLYLNNNRLTDATQLLCPKTKMMMTDLNLSNNFLSHELPDCWTKFDQLRTLHLENNQFFGNLPMSIGALKSLQMLHISSNNFSGQLPISMENCTSLIVLDVAHNSLTGHMPLGIGNTFRNLLLLNLRRNNFYGRLPLSLCELSHLQTLDLSGNHFSGTIPTCINNLKAMANGPQFSFSFYLYKNLDIIFDVSYDSVALMWKGKEQIFKNNVQLVNSIDVSNNHLEGHIPHEISLLKKLISLDLSFNNFTGSIIPEIGQLTSLEFLNLSNNHLCGHIPTSLATVSSLGTLDVSNNNLSGEIPTGTQLQGFDASRYKGNPLLCGPPLPKCSNNQAVDNANNRNQDENGDDGDYTTLLGLYISIILGFIVGFWGVCGTFVLKRSWRVAFFNFLADLKDKIWRRW